MGRYESSMLLFLLNPFFLDGEEDLWTYIRVYDVRSGWSHRADAYYYPQPVDLGPDL